MSGILKKVEQKLGDHPNVSADNSVNPDSGTGIGANDGHGMFITTTSVLRCRKVY